MKPNCYECKHRGTVAGDAHSCCRHPKLNSKNGCDYFDMIVRLLGGEYVEFMKEFGITAEAHGFEMGWFFWPVNFDPVWLLTCKMFEQKEI